MVLGEYVEHFMAAGNMDSSMHYLGRCREVARATGNTALLERADDVELNVRMYMNDSTVPARALALVKARGTGGSRTGLGTARELLAGVYIRNGQADTADSLMYLAQEDHRAARDTTRLCATLVTRMTTANFLGRYRMVLALGDTAIALMPRTHDRSLSTSVYIEQATAWNSLGRPDSMLMALEMGRASAVMYGDTLSLIQLLNNRGEFLSELGEFSTAMDHQAEMLRLVALHGPPNYLALAHLALAGSYARLGHAWDAYRHYKIAEREARTYGMQDLWPLAQADRAVLVATLDSATSASLGESFHDRVERAEATLDSALHDIQGIGQPKYEGQVELAMGEVLLMTGRSTEAMAHLGNALGSAAASAYAPGVMKAELQLARGSMALKRWPEAAAYLERCIGSARILRARPTLEEALQVRVRLLEAKGDTRAALEALHAAARLGEAIRNDTALRAITLLESRLAFSQAQERDSVRHMAELREVDNQRTIAELRAGKANNRLVFGAALAAVLLGGSAFAFRQDRKRRQLQFAKQAEELRRRAADLENQALRAQMDPHFISNTLNAINAFLYTNESDAASSLLARFAEWIRTMLETSRHTSVSLKDDLDALRTYLSLEQLRTDGKFDYTVEVDPDLDPATVTLPPLIVQPFLENAINHGVIPLKGKGHIVLRATIKDGALLLSVQDDGVGRKPQTPTGDGRKTSLSMLITRDRLKLLRERTGQPADFHVSDLPQGTRVDLVLPMAG